MSAKKKIIHLAKGLDIPLSVTTQKTSLMGGNGSGKTYAAMKMIEEVLRAGGWTIIVDPVGIHWGLRLMEDGVTPSGLDIPVFGGLHGDIILTPESGALVADLLCDRRLSAVLDVSHFETDADFNRWITAFGKQFFNRMKENRRAVMVVLEEAQEVLPQNPMEGEKQKLHVWQRIGKIGRNYGIGLMMISPRPQEIAKKVFNLTQFMLAFQMTGIHERRAMDDWCDYINFDIKLSQVLPTLEVGQTFIASPRWLKKNGTFHILPKTTYDSSSTPDFEDDADTVSLKPIDISALESKMQSLVEEAKANDPKELKREIARLKKDLEKRPVQVQPETKIERVEVPVIQEAQLEVLQTTADQIKMVGVDLSEAVADFNGIIKELGGLLQKANGYKPQPSKPIHIPTESARGTPVRTAKPALRSAPMPSAETSEAITGPMQKIIDAIAWMESINMYEPRRSIVAFLAGYSSKSTSFIKAMGRLNITGLATYPNSKSISLTVAGRAFANPQEQPLTTEELHRIVLAKLPGPGRRILQVLLEYPGEPVNREELAEHAGYSAKSTSYIKALGYLRSMDIIDYPSSTEAIALPVLFLE